MSPALVRYFAGLGFGAIGGHSDSGWYPLAHLRVVFGNLGNLIVCRVHCHVSRSPRPRCGFAGTVGDLRRQSARQRELRGSAAVCTAIK